MKVLDLVWSALESLVQGLLVTAGILFSIAGSDYLKINNLGVAVIYIVFAAYCFSSVIDWLKRK